MKVLVAGEAPLPGSSAYLLAVLKTLKARVTHVPAGQILNPRWLARRHDAFIFSDYPHRDLPAATEQAIVRQVNQGAGLLMIGGWASFSGPFGRWEGSRLEALLPVTCQRHDDRRDFSSGAFLMDTASHPLVQGLPFRTPPVICGLNDIWPRTNAHVVLTAHRIVCRGTQCALARNGFPVLALSTDARRTAAFATDAAPHWCGGLVDWGTKRVTVELGAQSRVEVGDQYVRCLSRLLFWLTRREDRRVTGTVPYGDSPL